MWYVYKNIEKKPKAESELLKKTADECFARWMVANLNYNNPNDHYFTIFYPEPEDNQKRRRW